MSNFTYTNPAPFGVAPTGVALHVRATVTNVSQTLDACCGGSLPTWTDGDRTYYPVMVQMQIESADSPAKVWVTMDGQSTAAATLGFEVALAPSCSDVPCPTGLRDAGIRLIADTNPTHVQCFFYMAPVVTR